MVTIAGLWEHWPSPDGGVVETCSIITTTANELMAPIHDRMPVILSPDAISSWLELSTKPDELKDLLRPCAPDILTAYTVSNLVNNPKFDGPSCIPTLAVFLSTDPVQWFPYNLPSQYIISKDPLECRPCYREDCVDWKCNDPDLFGLVMLETYKMVG